MCERFGHVDLCVAERRQQEHGSPGRPRQVTQEKQGRDVGPLRVLDDEHDRSTTRDAVEQIADRGVETVAFGIGIGLGRRTELTEPGRQVRQQPRQLPAPDTERPL